MTRSHRKIAAIDIVGGVLEDLLVAEHPVSVGQEKERGKLHFFDTIDSKGIVKSWWKSHIVGYDNSLADPLVKEIESSKREKKWHSHSIEASDVDNVKDSRVFEVNDIVWAIVESAISSHGVLLGLPLVARASIIETLLDLWNNIADRKTNVRQDCVNDHGLEYLLANISVPAWIIIVVLSLESLGGEYQSDTRFVLRQVSVNCQEEKTGVHELSDEHTVSDHS